MADAALESLLALTQARQGHFRLESGYHAAIWLELSTLFVQPKRLQPFVSRLASLLAPHAPDAICGPLLGGALVAQLLAAELGCEMYYAERVADADAAGLYAARYELPRALRPKVRGKRIAIVDDVVSAGSSVRATYAELEALGAKTVAIGALMTLGEAAIAWFAARRILLLAVAHNAFEYWPPDDCPLCAKGLPLDVPA